MKLLKLFVLGVLSSSFSYAGTSYSGKFNTSMNKQNYVVCTGNKPGAFYFYTNADGVTGQIVHQVTDYRETKSIPVGMYQIMPKGKMAVTFTGTPSAMYSYQISQNERGSNNKRVYFDVAFSPKMASFYNCEFVVLK